MTVPEWSGRRVTQARNYMTRFLPARCGAERHAPDCPGTVDGTKPWAVGHIKSRAEHPELTWAPSNWRIEHRACSDGTAHAVAIRKAKTDERKRLAEALRAAGIDDAAAYLLGLVGEVADEIAEDDGALFPVSPPPREGAALPLSLSEDESGRSGGHRPRVTATTKAAPTAISREPMEVRPELTWDPDYLAGFPWMRPFLDVPEDASVPLAMTPIHPEAVGSYGAAIIEWAEAEHKITLRWWQRLAIVRQHEHREDGTLCWAEVVESAPRRAGKSVRIRAVATWRISHADVIGEVQTVVHTGNDLPICREIQRGAWRWAEGRWGKGAVTTANGKEAIENTRDGSRWLVRSQGGVYGWDCSLGAVDEAWDVKPDTVTEGLEPAALERLWAQIHLTSTAHRRARSTMKSRIAACLADDDGRTLLLLWGARPQDDPGDPETWRAASPHWSEDRRRLIASKYDKALLGEDDPQADDPDPMEGFRAQYLNIWPLSSGPPARGVAVVDKAAWGELTMPTPDRVPDAAAIETHFDAGASVALAWRLPDGAALVRVLPADDLAAAGLVVTSSGFNGRTVVHGAVLADPGLSGLTTTREGSGNTLSAVSDLSRLLAEGQWAHDGSPTLTSQVLALSTLQGANGVRMASQGRVDGVKAAVWAAHAARATRPKRQGPMKVLMPSV